MTDEKTKKRCDELMSLDMKFNGGEMAYFGSTDLNRDFNVYPVEIQCDSEEEWSEKINKMKNELERRKNGI